MTLGVTLADDRAAAELEQVDLALSARRMRPLLLDAFGLAVAPCHVEDAKYAPGEGCTVLYRLGEDSILGLLRWDGERFDGGTMIPAADMQAFRFPDDPALPGLPAALEPLPVLRSLFPDVIACRATPLRYRPTRRATLRFDAALRGGRRRTLFVKVYHDLGKARQVDGVLRALAESAADDRHLSVAPPAALVETLGWVLYEPAEGVDLDLLLARGGELDALTAAARTLAALHAAAAPPVRPRPVEGELKRVRRRAARTRAIAPALGEAMAVLLAELVDRQPPPGEPVLIHGDCKPSQFLVAAANRVTLLDLDNCGLGDPASDVSAFQATLRRERVRAELGLRHRPTRTGEGFLDAYCAASGRDGGLRARVRWHEALSLLKKAQRAWARAPRSPLPSALVAEAQRCLEEMS